MKTNGNMNTFAGSDAPQRKAAGPWNPGHQNVRAPYLRKTGAISIPQPVLNKQVKGYVEGCGDDGCNNVQPQLGGELGTHDAINLLSTSAAAHAVGAHGNGL